MKIRLNDRDTHMNATKWSVLVSGAQFFGSSFSSFTDHVMSLVLFLTLRSQAQETATELIVQVASGPWEKPGSAIQGSLMSH